MSPKKKSKPETIVTKHKENFEQLRQAFKNNQACLLACKVRSTGEDIAVICAATKEPDGTVNLVPFAAFFNGNPFEILKSPTEIDEEATSKV